MSDIRTAVVWVADDRVAEGLDYGVRLLERLRERGYAVRREDLTASDGDGGDSVIPAELHVISGGGTSVNDLSGWMRGGLRLTSALVDGARRGDHAVLGVCLGSQMIAEVLWPGCVGGGERIAAGLRSVAWRGTGDLVVPSFHYEEVDRAVAERAGATVTAENARGGLQGFRAGDRLWGVQFHPELEPPDVRRLLLHHRHTLERFGSSLEQAERSVDELEPSWDRGVFDWLLDRVTTPQPAL
jgi:GMP synthase-like glutamine amidotransferase